MGEQTGLSRRGFLGRALTVSAGGLLLPALSGCGADDNGARVSGGLTCTDTSNLTTSERSLRESLQYVDNSPYGEERNCANCQFFRAAGEGECGRCDPVKGPIHPLGYCTIWSPHPS